MPIRWRLTIFNALAIGVILLLLGIGIFFVLRETLLSDVEGTVQTRAETAARSLVAPQQSCSATWRDPSTPNHLPVLVQQHIARLTAAPDADALLSHRQCEAAWHWGRDRRNVEREREWHRLADCAQAWTLLEGIGCLAYEQK